MSQWVEVKTEDIDLDYESKEIHIHAGYDEWGNNYFTLTFDQIKEIYEKINT